LGQAPKQEAQAYAPEIIMQRWESLIEETIKKTK
jgi:hypothetical protein